MDRPTEEKAYNWCKCICDPAENEGRDHYYLHFLTRESRWEQPDEPYWLWDSNSQCVDLSGLHYPSNPSRQYGPKSQSRVPLTIKFITAPNPVPDRTSNRPAVEPDPEYQGYNPRIHGKYDPNAPYAQYHNKLREAEAVAADPELAAAQGHAAGHDTAATFNRFTGAFQGADKSAERHNDSSKSARQLNAFFDVDAAANAHEGRSLKAERQQQKFSKKEIKEMASKRREKKEKKRMDFYRS